MRLWWLRLTLGVVALSMGACGTGQDPVIDASEALAAPEAGDVAAYSSGADPRSSDGSGARDSYAVELVADGTVRGTAFITLVPERAEVCYRIDVEGMPEAAAAHVHEAVGSGGEVALNLQPPVEGTVDACVTADAPLLRRLARDPSSFSLDVHVTDHAGPVLRGWLGS